MDGRLRVSEDNGGDAIDVLVVVVVRSCLTPIALLLDDSFGAQATRRRRWGGGVDVHLSMKGEGCMAHRTNIGAWMTRRPAACPMDGRFRSKDEVGRDVLRIIIATPIDVVFIRAALDRAGLLVRDNYDESLPNMPVVSPYQPSSFILLGIIIHQNTNVIRKKLRRKRCGRKQRIQTVRLTTPTEVSTGWW